MEALGRKKTLINLGTCVVHVNFVEIFMPMLLIFVLLHQQDFEKILTINHDFIIIVVSDKTLWADQQNTNDFGQKNVLTLLNHVTSVNKAYSGISIFFIYSFLSRCIFTFHNYIV